jgi:hypothetical protein
MALTMLPLVGLAVIAPVNASAGAPAREEQESGKVEASPEITAELQALDIKDAALTEDATKFLETHPPAQNASADKALAKRIEALDPDQVLQALEELRKEGMTAAATPDFEQRLEKKLGGLPAAPAPAPEATGEVETRALGPAEVRLCSAFPGFCATSFALGRVAERTARRYGKLHNGKGDAFKHAYWSALMTFYQTETWAKALGNAHEARPHNPALERRMDLHNNAVGRGHGKRAIIISSVDDGVDRSFRRGDLVRIACGRKGRSHLVATNRRGDYCR